jgi:hypothetical protein
VHPLGISASRKRVFIAIERMPVNENKDVLAGAGIIVADRDPIY